MTLAPILAGAWLSVIVFAVSLCRRSATADRHEDLRRERLAAKRDITARRGVATDPLYK